MILLFYASCKFLYLITIHYCSFFSLFYVIKMNKNKDTKSYQVWSYTRDIKFFMLSSKTVLSKGHVTLLIEVAHGNSLSIQVWWPQAMG